MPETIAPAFRSEPQATGSGWLTNAARRAVCDRLNRLRGVRLNLNENGTTVAFGQHEPSDAELTIDVHDAAFYRDVLFGGHLGAAESYVRGAWDCNDLVGLIRGFARHLDQADGLENGVARAAGWVARMAHLLRRNTLNGSRRNIHAHYDLGNDFFELFLDPSLTYSCAWFGQPGLSLQQAQAAKYDRICRAIALNADDHVIEIGTGWGGFAIYAASRCGARVTTTTISEAQHRLARERIERAGLADRITLLQQDYRQLGGRYDKLVSVEMIEAVGAEYYPAYFRKCAELLKGDGRALIQAITIADQRYDTARRHTDFIKRYVFPGSCIPSVTAMCDAMTRVSDLRLEALDDLTPHYATTLRLWRQNLNARRDEAIGLGYDRQLLRLWNFYLSYCEAGFSERTTGLVHMHLVKPGWRSEPAGEGVGTTA